MTSNPPLYGADTPTSFFDARLPFGWNLRDLQVLKKASSPVPLHPPLERHYFRLESARSGSYGGHLIGQCLWSAAMPM